MHWLHFSFSQVNQAMASGVPVVATSIAVEGMHVVPERDCIVAHTVEALVEGLERVGRGMHAPVTGIYILATPIHLSLCLVT